MTSKGSINPIGHTQSLACLPGLVTQLQRSQPGGKQDLASWSLSTSRDAVFVFFFTLSDEVVLHVSTYFYAHTFAVFDRMSGSNTLMCRGV